MELDSADLLPIPKALADLPVRSIAPYGPLVAGGDVARAFRTKPSTLRTWRERGRFPDPAYALPNVSYYRVADLVGEYYRRFPGELPDRPEQVLQDALGRFYAVALETGAVEGGAVATPVASRLGESGEGAAQGVTLSEAFRRQQIAVFQEAVAGLLVREPEPPAVIEALAAELTAQRAEIERLRAELAEARAREEEASQWRFKPVWDRVMKR